MNSTESAVRQNRLRVARKTLATSLRVTPACLNLWDTLAFREGLTRTGYLETTIRRIAAEKNISTEPASLADAVTQAAMSGPIHEIWDTPEEDAAWAHLNDLE